MENEILNEITNFCNECASKECCPENECILYRIEQKVTNEKKTYNVEIKETLSRIIEVEATSEDDAIDIVESQYKNEEIVLYPEDYKGYDIDIFKA